MANEIYNTIADNIIALIKADAEFSDIVKYYPYTKTLEAAAFPCCFVAKTSRESNADELGTGSEDTLTYQVEIYYKDDHGREVEQNKKDIALKNLIDADRTLGGIVSDAQCYSSTINSQMLDPNNILTVLAARVVVFV